MKEDKGLLIVGSADVWCVLCLLDCIDAVDTAMRALSSGRADVPLRTVMKLPGGRNFFGVMPGYLSEPQGLGTKIITIFPDNAKLGLSSHVGLVLLFDSEIGFPLAVMDAGEETAIRTAAASAVATRALARQDAAHLAILGTGEQAITHLEAIAQVRALKSVRVWGRTASKAAAFAQQHGSRLGLAIEVSGSVESAVRAADINCTVTSSCVL